MFVHFVKMFAIPKRRLPSPWLASNSESKYASPSVHLCNVWCKLFCGRKDAVGHVEFFAHCSYPKTNVITKMCMDFNILENGNLIFLIFYSDNDCGCTGFDHIRIQFFTCLIYCIYYSFVNLNIFYYLLKFKFKCFLFFIFLWPN